MRLVTRGANAHLQAVDLKGVVNRFALEYEDIALLQSRLDTVDNQLAPLSAKSGAPINGPLVCLVLGLLAAICSFQYIFPNSITLSLLLCCLIAAATRQRAWVEGLGIMAILAFLLVFWHHVDRSWWSFLPWFCLPLIAIMGLYLVWSGAAIEKHAPPAIPKSSPSAIAFLFALPALWLVALVFYSFRDGEMMLRLYAMTTQFYGFFWFPSVRQSGRFYEPENEHFSRVFLLWEASCSAIFLSPAILFLIRFARDEMAHRLPPPQTFEIAFPSALEAEVRGRMWNLHLNPEGTHLLTELSDPKEGRYDRTFLISDFEGNARELQALQTAFAKGKRLLSLTQEDQSVVLNLIDLDNPDQITWNLPAGLCSER